MLSSLKSKLRHRRLKKKNIFVRSNSNNSSDVHDNDIIFLGKRSGVWPILKSELPKKNIISYSFGLGNNISWELEFIDNFDVEIFAYDPTPSSVDWIEQQTLPKKLHFFPIGLADYCGDMPFFIPRREGRFNYSVVKRASKYPNETVNCPVKDLKTLCSENEHRHIDILKLDIEGSEITALPSILNSGISIDQLLIEFHYNYNGISFDETINLIYKLEEKGYQLFWLSERAYEFGFVKNKD